MKNKIVSSILCVVALISFFVWNNSDNIEGTPVNSDYLNRNWLDTKEGLNPPLQYAVRSLNPVYTFLIIEECEYMTNITIEGFEYMKKIDATVNSYVHKGNCKNPIHPENTVDWEKLNRLLNLPMLQGLMESN